MAQSQNEQKITAGRAAIEYVTPGTIVGVGTGSTVDPFIQALGEMPEPIAGAVSSSHRSTTALKALGIKVFDANEVDRLDIYVDGADEIDPLGYMVKGGGGALTREKIVAALADRFICIADASKRVHFLGAYPLPVEVIPMAAAAIKRRFAEGILGTAGRAKLRLSDRGEPYVTDNGQHILDVQGLKITEPLEFESAVNDIPGVVTVGIFAYQKANVLLLGTPGGLEKVIY
ncbi:MAG TPA: ribose-5-phosphate isomerase RpiA [Actinomycetaceae bacterium]|nr:ribose-5-phosphate isomerase RpiA [Actinomycetaceae bacterium]